jgi:cbb3-type cytochrome oxidase cytochrome c subunit
MMLLPTLTVFALLVPVPQNTSQELRGAQLLGELRCLACHQTTETAGTHLLPPPAPNLTGIGTRATVDWIARFLADPQGTKPGTSMPDPLWGMGDSARERVAQALAHALTSEGEPLDRTPVEAVPGDMEIGRQLYHNVGCVACHIPLETPWKLEVPYWMVDEFEWAKPDPEANLPASERVHRPYEVPLGDLASKTSVTELARFLEDPLSVRPAGRMPDMHLSSREARQIAMYLLREQASGQEEFPGLSYLYFEDDVRSLDDLAFLEPVRRGVALDLEELPENRGDHFGFRFQGFIEVRETGSWEFFLRSDDGSALTIDGQEVVNNDGIHPSTEATGTIYLDSGRHSIEVQFFESGGGEELSLSWSGPGVEKRPVDPVAFSHSSVQMAPPAAIERSSPSAIRAGSGLFVKFNCVLCHEIPGTLFGLRVRDTLPLLALDPDAARSCFSEQGIPHAPHYELNEQDRDAIRAALRKPGTLLAPLEGEALLRDRMARLRCYACHERGGVGSPSRERRPYFLVAGEADLGDEGRIPPHLDGVGEKLHPEWIAEVLLKAGRARPYMATRMPGYGEENVGALVDLLVEIDATTEGGVEPEISPDTVRAGRLLVGTSGLGCIQCHTFSGYKSLGIPAVDLADVHRRIRPGWFRQLLSDPISLNMNSRMPEFWTDEGLSPVQDVLDGDIPRQIDAIRAYLSLGSEMPLPEGLIIPDASYELDPTDRALLCGVFMAGMSPKTLLVGSPDGLHYAFDLQGSRLGKAWRGRFFNARGTWHARAGALENPPTDHVLILPQGAPLAVLGDPPGVWPKAMGRDAGYRRLGRRFDADGMPTFRYRVEHFEVEEFPHPETQRDGIWLARSFHLSPHRPRRTTSTCACCSLTPSAGKAPTHLPPETERWSASRKMRGLC